MRLEGADLLDHRLPQRLLGRCYGAATGGGCSPGRGPADIGTPSELPTGGAPGICPAVSERPVLTRPGGLRRVGRTRPLAPDWVARDRREKSERAGQGYPAARRDGRRPASLVTRRDGVWRRVRVRGQSRATNGATTHDADRRSGRRSLAPVGERPGASPGPHGGGRPPAPRILRPRPARPRPDTTSWSSSRERWGWLPQGGVSGI